MMFFSVVTATMRLKANLDMGGQTLGSAFKVNKTDDWKQRKYPDTTGKPKVVMERTPVGTPHYIW